MIQHSHSNKYFLKGKNHKPELLVIQTSHPLESYNLNSWDLSYHPLFTAALAPGLLDSLKIGKEKVRDVTYSVMCLLHKHKDLSLSPRTHIFKSKLCWLFTRNPGAGKLETGEPLRVPSLLYDHY